MILDESAIIRAPRLILISGVAGAGKSTLAKQIVINLEFDRIASTDTIREVVLDGNNEGSIDLPQKEDTVKKIGLVVAGATLHTYQPSAFNLVYPD